MINLGKNPKYPKKNILKAKGSKIKPAKTLDSMRAAGSCLTLPAQR